MGIDAAQQQLKTHAGSFYGLAQIYTPEFLSHCDGLLAKAAAAAKGDSAYEQRVAMHTEGLHSARAYRAISEAMNRGDFVEAQREYDATIDRLKPVIENGYANREYCTAYLKRFLSESIAQGVTATSSPNRLIQVIPDRWRFSFDEGDNGNDQGFHKTDFDDKVWPLVATFNTTLDVQGYDKNTVFWYRSRFELPEKKGKFALFFGEVDGKSEVYVNGQKLAVPEKHQSPKKAGATSKPMREGLAKPRQPFEVDVTDAIHPGENTVALRVDHSTITELSLGGILRPVLLIAKPE